MRLSSLLLVLNAVYGFPPLTDLIANFNFNFNVSINEAPFDELGGKALLGYPLT
jgi:hypothetical protein